MPNKATDPTVANRNFFIIFFSIPVALSRPKRL